MDEEIDPSPLSETETEENDQLNADFKANNYFSDWEKEVEAFDNNLPKTVTLLRGEEGSKLYLVGTAHFSIESQNDVSKVIKTVRPHIVVVELCKRRALILQMDEEAILQEAKSLTTEKMVQTIKEHGVLQGLMYILLLNLSSQLTKDLGMAPGGEFRRAFQEVKKLPGCMLSFGDRPIQVTLKRVLLVLSWWRRITLAFSLLFNNQKISREDVEKYKETDLLVSVVEKMIKDFPELGKVFVVERDVYLTYSLQLATQHQFYTHEGVRVPTVAVGVVGIGHTPGIKERWGRVSPTDIPPIMEMSGKEEQGVRWRRVLLFGALALGAWQVLKRHPIPSRLAWPF